MERLTKKPFLSVVVPTYNSISIFERCPFILDSKICKTHGVEIIISDDSETNIVLELVKNYSHIRYLRHSSTGNAVDNWNFGLDSAKGNFFWLLHHDEYLTDLELLINQLKVCEHESIDLIILKLFISKGPHLHAFRSHFIKYLFLKYPFLLYAFNVFGSPSVFIYRSQEIRFNNKMKWLVDVDFLVTLLKRHRKKILTNIPVVSDPIEVESITNTIDNYYDLHVSELEFLSCHPLVKLILRVLIFFRYFRK